MLLQPGEGDNLGAAARTQLTISVRAQSSAVRPGIPNILPVYSAGYDGLRLCVFGGEKAVVSLPAAGRFLTPDWGLSWPVRGPAEVAGRHPRLVPTPHYFDGDGNGNIRNPQGTATITFTVD